MKKVLFLTLALLLVLSSTACASGKSLNAETAYDSEVPTDMKGDYYVSTESSDMLDASMNGTGGMDSVEMPEYDTGKDNDLANRKIIKRVNMEMQTEEYDNFFASVKSLIASTGSYIQSSTVYDKNGKNANRIATVVVRVPADKLTQFTDGIYGGATVTYYNEDLDDVTTSYADIESRIESLSIELDALNKLLAEAVDLQYVISLHDRITDIRYELDKYESSIRNYDELIAYSTVTLHISEVKRVTIVEEQSTWEEIGTNLSENISDIGEFFRRAFIDIASGLPYIAILVVVFGTATVIIVKKVKKHRKNKNSEDK